MATECGSLQGVAAACLDRTAILAQEARNHRPFIDAGGLRAVLSLMDSFPTVMTVQNRGSATLAYLVTRSDGLEKTVADEGAVSRLMRTAETFSTESLPMKHVCGALTGIAYDKRNKAQLLTAGVMEMVVQAMIDHPRMTDMLSYCCMLLKSLGCCPNDAANRQRLIDLGAIRLVTVSLLVVANDRDNQLQVSACAMLHDFCSGFEDVPKTAKYKKHCANLGVFNNLFALVKMFPDAEVYREVIELVRRLCFQMPNLRRRAREAHFLPEEIDLPF